MGIQLNLGSNMLYDLTYYMEVEIWKTKITQTKADLSIRTIYKKISCSFSNIFYFGGTIRLINVKCPKTISSRVWVRKLLLNVRVQNHFLLVNLWCKKKKEPIHTISFARLLALFLPFFLSLNVTHHSRFE